MCKKAQKWPKQERSESGPKWPKQKAKKDLKMTIAKIEKAQIWATTGSKQKPKTGF